MSWITKFTNNFNNADQLYKQKEQGVSRRLIGFELLEKGIPRKDYEITDSEGNIIGKVTSGTQSPSLQKAIGMGYVQTSFAEANTEIYIQVRKKSLKAKVVKTPFYKGK